MSEQTTAAPVVYPSHTPRLSWPPPGLEPLQGSIWRVIAQFAFGAAVLAGPLLLAIAGTPS